MGVAELNGVVEREETTRESVLNPVDRVSEMLFGLFMALTFVGAVSVAGGGREHVRELFITAFGCNLAWGLADAILFLVRTITDSGRKLTLLRSIREAPDAETGRNHLESELSRVMGHLVSSTELEAIRGRIVALPSIPTRPALHWDDVRAALAIFCIVVAATFPVVLPFALISDVGAATMASRALSLVMLFFGGMALGNYSGYGIWRVGFMMVGLGTALVAAIIALGG